MATKHTPPQARQTAAQRKEEHGQELRATFLRLADRLEEAAAEIRRYMKRPDSDEHATSDDRVLLIDLASWSLNTWENAARNVNAATMLHQIARYAVTAHEASKEAEEDAG